jgi:hypothetical protein
MPEHTQKKDDPPQNPLTVDPMDGVGDFLSSVNNYERIWAAEHSVPGYHSGSKNQKKNLNPKVRAAVGGEINDMFSEGSISPGEVLDTYQSSFDKGNDFGGEVALNGVWGNEYVLHGHYDEKGKTQPGSVGVKKSSDKYGMRIAHGVPDQLGGDSSELFQHFNS